MTWHQIPMDRTRSRNNLQAGYGAVMGKGLTLRAKVPGSAIAAARQLRIRSGQFLISRIDARHGAFGIVLDELYGALVRNDFPCFDIDARLVIPRYFEYYSRTSAFVGLCRLVSEGSTNRVRLRENEFLNVQIPIPHLDEQRRIVARLDRVLELIEKRRQAIAASETDMQVLQSKAFERAIAGAHHGPMAEVAPLVRCPLAEIGLDRSYPELGVRSFGRGTFHKPALVGIDGGTKKVFRIVPGDLVFTSCSPGRAQSPSSNPRTKGGSGPIAFSRAASTRHCNGPLPPFLLPDTPRIGAIRPGIARRIWQKSYAWFEEARSHQCPRASN